jgi:hypothetical protein
VLSFEVVKEVENFMVWDVIESEIIVMVDCCPTGRVVVRCSGECKRVIFHASLFLYSSPTDIER